MSIDKKYKIVLSDKLYSIYKKATFGEKLKPKELKIYEKTLQFIDLDILTNLAQLKTCKESHNLPEQIYDDLEPVLLTDELRRDLSLEELAQHTIYKLVLTQADEQIKPPFFNINRKNILREYMLNCKHEEDRGYLIEYLKSLLAEAKKILIYDNYFYRDKGNSQFFSLLPNKKLQILYIENQSRENGTFIKQHATNQHWKLIRCDTTRNEFNRFARSHDRYLIIDDSLEITLTSGFTYLWNKSKEITCIIRQINKTRS